MEQRPLNIALVTLWRVNNSRGGAEKVFFDMADNLVRRGHHVICLANDFAKGKPFFYLNPKIEYHNLPEEQLLGDRIIQALKEQLIRFVFMFMPNGIARRKKRREILNNVENGYAAKLMKKYLCRSDIDVIVSFQPEATALIVDMVKPGAPVITMFHFHPSKFLGDEDSSYNGKYNDALKRCSCIQVLRPEFIDETKRVLPEQEVVCIPNIVPVHHQRADTSAKVIGFLGRIERRQKRPLLLVEAFSLIKNRFPDWTVRLYGETHVDKKYVREIQNLIKMQGLEEQVKLCGPTSQPLDVLAQTSIFCFPSAFEAFSLALAEAMSLGIPVIGCKKAPSVDGLIVNNHNGLLADATPEAIAQALSRLMEDQEFRMRLGNQARQDMEAYQPERIWDAWEVLLYNKATI
ncbi:MAG: glycosyltransferase [Alistipes senegalensis]|nr:glycosyltransferase [Oxalobacter formigenes]MCM1281563.1 glycosyltransferase [Alistipes senegalensis]